MSKQKFTSLRGFNDVLPAQSYQWNKVLAKLVGILEQYSFGEIKIPMIEPTALFARGVGEATDVVEKEMFAVDSRDGEPWSLRPEGTASTMRAGLQHGLFFNQEQRLYYFGPMFRYERPQKGRLRQFHQLGVEVLGIKTPALDAEVLLMLRDFWQALEISDYLTLEINNIGSSAARAAFGKALVAFLEPLKDQLDPDSQKRLYKNPLRILDSKDANTQKLLEGAPKLEDFIDEESKTYFQKVLDLLTAAGLSYKLNSKLVRGLDYYNDVVFEWTTDKLGAQATVCGGGRYDGLVELFGGQPTPGFGFGLGWERLLLLLEEVGKAEQQPAPSVFVIAPSEDLVAHSFAIAAQVRKLAPGLRVLNNTAGGKLKKQFQKADKLGAQFVLIAEAENQVSVKDLAKGEQVTVGLDALGQFFA